MIKIFSILDEVALETELSLRAINEVSKYEGIIIYEGFNPREIQKALLNAHENTKRICEDVTAIEKIEYIVVNGESKTFKFSNNMPFNTDIEFICLMFIIQRSAYEKIMRKSSEVMKNYIRIMKTKYNINIKNII